MEIITRRPVDPVYSMCVQPSFIIGTNNEDGTASFAPITWVSVPREKGEGYLLVISMFGTKKTKQNVLHQDIDDPPCRGMRRDIHLPEGICRSLEHHGAQIHHTVHKAHGGAGGEHPFDQFLFQPEISISISHYSGT